MGLEEPVLVGDEVVWLSLSRKKIDLPLSKAKIGLLSVLISHLVWAHRCVDMMVGHINAGASDLDRAFIGLSRSTLALEDSLYLGDIDLKWLYRLAKK